MKMYFLRRFLLLPPTLLGITFLVFAITRFVPGGPLDRMLQQAAGDADSGSKNKTSMDSNSGLSEEQLEELEEQYGLDKSIGVSYLQWLGVWPREIRISKGEFGLSEDMIGGNVSDPHNVAKVVLRGDGRLVELRKEGESIVSVNCLETNVDIRQEGWKIRYENELARQERFKKRNLTDSKPPNYQSRAVIYQTSFSGLLQGDFGRSTVYNDPVADMILERVPVAVYFGLLTAFITYAVCIPLGILKALKHRTFIDSFSSVLIFIGYAIPGFAFGAILLIHFGARMNLFPLFGLTSPGFMDMSLVDQLKDLAHHTVLPLFCYLIGSFAMLTMLVKNNLMDQLSADYVRTAVAKGVSFPRAVFSHAFRNSIIPIATSMGGLVEIFIGGSILVETIFDIQGFGLLQYQAVIARDVPVIMGTLTIAAFLMLLGKILSDMIVVLVDPRIKFK